jgi:ATP-dependent helicase/nuclease subunit A
VNRPLADQAARDRIEQDLATTLVVEAAAGTGKTSALVRRMVAVVGSGAGALAEMVAVTFTDAAAGELKLRLRAAIEQTRQDPTCPPAMRDRLTAALPQLEEARIGTIHSFCGDLLRERPVEARVDPSFQVAGGEIARTLFDRAFDRWFEDQLAAPPEGMRRILRRRLRFDQGPRARLRQAAFELAQWRDFPTPWRRVPFERDAAIDELLGGMVALARWAAQGDPEDHFTRSLREIERFVEEVGRHERVRGDRDYDGLEAELVRVSRERHWKWVGFQRGTAPEFPKAQLRRERDDVYERLQRFVADAGADIAPCLQLELRAVLERYEVLKARGGYVDFLDLLLRARDLVRDDAVVRGALQARFRHVFVDEFQDTDPLQAELLLLLAADDPAETDWRRVRPVPGKLFVVGDPKQSIYRFRRADVALYQAIKERLLDAGAVLLHLQVSFRSVPALQQLVNAAFSPCMTGATMSQPAYVPLAPMRPPLPGQPAVVALPVPRPYGDYRKVVDWKIEQSLPDAVAAYIDWLVRESGWLVTERDRGAVPIRPRHICVLFRRFRTWNDDVTRPYVRALEARALPHVLVGGTSFHQREEVAALRNALAAIERPDDELMVFATLRGPLFALTDGQLLTWREQLTTLHPFREAPPTLSPALAEVASALAVLRELHRARNRRPLAETVSRLLAATRAHAGLAIWPTGEQALANVARLMDLARRAERSDVVSFRAFVDRLFADAAHGEAGEAPIVEEGTEGVRLMTVHKAKGLEFPVVVLADATAKGLPSEPGRWVDPATGVGALRLAGCAPPELLEHAAEEIVREQEEGTRLLYVAATRARDLLVVPAVGDAPYDGWLAPLHPVVYPAPEETRAPAVPAPVGCPAFGPETIALRPANVRRPLEAVAPGEHRSRVGEHAVVWWDPTVLRLDVQETVGLRQQKFLEADEGGRQSDAGIRAHAAWQAARTRVRAAGGQPALRVATATEFATRPHDVAADVAVESVDDIGPRPHGKRFGSLVHAALAAVALRADATVVAAVVALTGRVFGATEAESAAASETVQRALAHPLLRRAAAAPCRREMPLAIRLEDGTLVEGVVDAAFEEADGWTVVDFKTDVELAGRLDEYRRQVALYARAIAQATGRPARPVLLRV